MSKMWFETVLKRAPLAIGAAITTATVAGFAPLSMQAVRAETNLVVAELAPPLPRLNPRRKPTDPIANLIDGGDDGDGVAVSAEAPASQPPKAPLGFKLAVTALEKGDTAAATLASYTLPDPASADLVSWLVATSGDKEVPSNLIADTAGRLNDWPGQTLMRLRMEQALLREEPSDATLLARLGSRQPETPEGTLALAGALKRADRTAEARELIRSFWGKKSFGKDIESELLESFASYLSTEDHKARMDRLLYDQETDAALRTAKHLDKGQRALATAIAAALKRQKKAAGLLDNLSDALKQDPLYLYARVVRARRADKPREAAEFLAKAPKSQVALVDPDAWWVERRIVSRALAERGDARRAYEVAAGHSARAKTRLVEAEFHAGWFALEFLNDPIKAAPHFNRIAEVSSGRLSQSRAAYWLGRTARANGDDDDAERLFRQAGSFPATFYGQLALAELGATTLPMEVAPKADADQRARFDDREFVKVIRLLIEANYLDRAGAFFRRLAGEISEPQQMRLLSELAESAELYQVALQVGIIGSARGLPIDDLAFSTTAIPSGIKTSGVEKPVVYAIARQESRFNHEAISSAGARGLLQLMPATARETARGMGLRYSKSRLTSDPAYNATLGANYLSKMITRFDGSYIMTFAAYNAGASRVDDWIDRFGDPRDPKVDVVNWIESIPFTETRNYVQRIMENLQAYRFRFGDRSLVIEKDLRRRGTS